MLQRKNIIIFFGMVEDKSQNISQEDEFVLLLNLTTRLQDSSCNLSAYENGTILWCTNLSDNATFSYQNAASVYLDDHLLATILTSAILALLILATVVGNVFVIAAILLERNLQGVGNCLVLSLAVADLMVACLVMPLSAMYEVTQEWTLGPTLCDIWTSCDVLCCTASILHLLAIAVDRYWAVTNVDYIRQRGARQIASMITIVWTMAFLVSFAPLFGWKDPEFLIRVEVEKRCLISQDTAYQIFATCSTFYVPLILTLLLYWKIYQVARKRIRKKPGSKANLKPNQMASLAPPTIEMSVISDASGSLPNSDTTLNSYTNGITDSACEMPKKKKRRHRRETLEIKRERKAAKTLAIITGVFVFCWMPFFVTVLIMALNSGFDPNPYLFSFFLWLGYVNSMINPIIYTIFSPDFRNAFKRILCGKSNRRIYIK